MFQRRGQRVLHSHVAAGHQVSLHHRTGSPAHYFAIDPGAAGQRGGEVFQHHRAGPFSQHHAGAVEIEGPARLLGVAVAGGDLFLLQGVDDLHGVQAGAGGSAEHDVGPAAEDDLEGLGDRQVGAGLPHGDRVIRALEVVVDGQVAGGHVGQVLQEPQGATSWACPPWPSGRSRIALVAQALLDAFGEVVGHGQHVVAAEGDARPGAGRRCPG